MKNIWRNPYLRTLLLALLLVGMLCTGCTGALNSDNGQSTDNVLAEDGCYTAPQDVADYLHIYAHLPDNFITKNGVGQSIRQFR